MRLPVIRDGADPRAISKSKLAVSIAFDELGVRTRFQTQRLDQFPIDLKQTLLIGRTMRHRARYAPPPGPPASAGGRTIGGRKHHAPFCTVEST